MSGNPGPGPMDFELRRDQQLVKSVALERKIQDRKEDVKRAARARQLEDLRRIQSLNSTSTIGGGVDPITILSEEAWDIVLSFLCKPEDLENARKSCKTFQTILEKRRIADILLPKTLEIYQFRKSLRELKGRRYGYRDVPQQMPAIIVEDMDLMRETRADYQLGLKLRTLSKSFRNREDSNIQRKFDESLKLFDLDGNRNHIRRIKTLTFIPTHPKVGDRRFYTFLKNIDPDQNDFPAKRLSSSAFSCSLTESIDYRKHMDEVTTFMTRIGDQILHFRLEIAISETVSTPGVTINEAYNYLQDWADRMPNLKWLDLKLVKLSTEDSVPLSLVKAAIRSRTFPRLLNLKVFLFTLQNNDPCISEVIATIMEANQHLQEISINYDSSAPNEDDLRRIMQALHALNLKTLSFSATFYITFHEFFNPNWPLQRIRLEIQRCIRSDSYASIKSIFELLHCYKTTLTHVALQIRLPMSWLAEPLDLPNVTTFSIRFRIAKGREGNPAPEEMQDLNSIDYLIPMAKLEELIWLNDGAAPDLFECSQEKELIKFDGGRYDLLSKESNIWNVFPSLKKVSVQVDSSSRKHIYSRYQRK